MRTLITACVCAALAAAQSRTLPPDIDKESYSRLPLKKRADFSGDELRIYDSITRDPQGNPRATPPLGPAATSLYSLGVALPMNDLNQYVRRTVAGPAIYQLCTLIAARELTENYEWASHEPGALRAGIAQESVDAIKYDRSTEGLPEKEALVIRFGRAIFREPRVPAELYQAVVKEFGEQGMFEITAIIGDYAMAAIMLKAVDQHVPNEAYQPLPEIRYTAR
jgi:4-carboxymuconolactone decarboxylase